MFVYAAAYGILYKQFKMIQVYTTFFIIEYVWLDKFSPVLKMVIRLI